MMLEGKKGNLNLFIEHNSLVTDVAICVSWKVKINSCCLNKLKGVCSCECFPQGSEEACLCYAIFLHVKNNLCGNPLAVVKSKVADVHCGVNGGEFFICWKVKGTGSAIRKSIGIVLKSIDPAKQYNAYGHCVKQANGKLNKDVFIYIADDLVKSIKDQVQCCVVGNIKLVKKDPETKKEIKAVDINAMLDVLHKKISLSSVSGKKEKPTDHVPCNHENKTEVKASGIDSFIVKDFISAKIRGVTPLVCDKYVLLDVPPKKWDTVRGNIKKQVKDYVSLKYDKLKEDLAGVLAYVSIVSGTVGCNNIHSLLKNKIKGSDVEKVLNQAL